MADATRDVVGSRATMAVIVPLAASVGHRLDLPVIPINGACVWDALRRRGIEDRRAGRGRLVPSTDPERGAAP